MVDHVFLFTYAFCSTCFYSMVMFQMSFDSPPLYHWSSASLGIYQMSTTVALSNCVSKILETLLLDYIESHKLDSIEKTYPPPCGHTFSRVL